MKHPQLDVSIRAVSATTRDREVLARVSSITSAGKRPIVALVMNDAVATCAPPYPPMRLPQSHRSVTTRRERG